MTKTSPTGQRCVRTVSLRVLALAINIYVTYMDTDGQADEATE